MYDKMEKERPAGTELALQRLQMISFVGLITGVILRYLHIPHAYYVVFIFMFCVAVFSFMVYFRKPDKTLTDHIQVLLLLTWTSASLLMYFHIPGPVPWRLVIAVSFFAWVILRKPVLPWQPGEETPSPPSSAAPPPTPSLSTLLDSDPPARKRYRQPRMLFPVAAAITTLGALFKIMHWPGAGIMLIAGMVSGAVWFIWDYFANEE